MPIANCSAVRARQFACVPEHLSEHGVGFNYEKCPPLEILICDLHKSTKGAFYACSVLLLNDQIHKLDPLPNREMYNF